MTHHPVNLILRILSEIRTFWNASANHFVVVFAVPFLVGGVGITVEQTGSPVSLSVKLNCPGIGKFTPVIGKKDGEVYLMEDCPVTYGACLHFNKKGYMPGITWNCREHDPQADIEPIEAVLGAGYAASKRYWQRIRGLEGLMYYGSDEAFLSLKVWGEGGRGLLLKDTVIGHIYRDRSPYKRFCEEEVYNYLFIADVLFPASLRCMAHAVALSVDSSLYAQAVDLLRERKERNGRLREEIAAVLPHFVGEIMQIPPKYSAKNVGGKRGYELARAGVDFTLAPKKVNIYSITLASRISADQFAFVIECGGGTYIRSLCRDIASYLGTYAAMSALTRLSSGPFLIEDARPSASLTAENIAEFIVPTDSVLPFKGIYVGGNEQKKLLNGLPVPSPEADGTYKIYLENGQFYGLGKAANGCLKVETKLC